MIIVEKISTKKNVQVAVHSYTKKLNVSSKSGHLRSFQNSFKVTWQHVKMKENSFVTNVECRSTRQRIWKSTWRNIRLNISRRKNWIMWVWLILYDLYCMTHFVWHLRPVRGMDTFLAEWVIQPTFILYSHKPNDTWSFYLNI